MSKWLKTGILFQVKLTRIWMTIKRGQIIFVDLEPVTGSEQGKKRPCLVIQNNIGNQYSPNTIVVPFTSKLPDKEYPTVVVAETSETGLKKKSAILCNHIRTISKQHRIIKSIGMLKPATMKKVDTALKESLALE